MPYVKLTRAKHIRKGGVQESFHKGDWVNVGKQTASAWLADGSAMIPGPDSSKMEVVRDLLNPECGVRVLGKPSGPWPNRNFGNCLKVLKFSNGPLDLPYLYTMLWNPTAPLTPRQVLIGFSQITSRKKGSLAWEMVARLAGTKLARDVGTEAEQKKTKALIGDLRIPVYDTRILWVRKTDNTTQLISEWAAAIVAGEDEAHAFLRALYARGVLLCTLPAV